jgi:hypothetical protein
METELSAGHELVVDDLIVLAAAARTGDGFRSPAETAAVIGSRVAVALGYERVSVTLLDHADPAPELPTTIWAQVIEAGETGVPTLIRDLHERPEPELAGLAATGSWRSAAFVPVSARGHLIGTLNAFGSRPGEHSSAELERLQAAARVAGVAIDVALTAQRFTDGADPGVAAGLAELSEAQNALTRVALEPSGDAVNAVSERLAVSLGTSVLVWDVPGAKTRAFAGEPEFRSRVTDLLAGRDPVRLGRTTAGSDLGGAVAYPIGRDRTLGLLVLDPGRLAAASAVADGLVQHAVALLAFDLEAERAERQARNVSRPSILHALVSGRLSSRQATDVGPFVDATGQAMRIGFLTVADDATATATSHRLNFSSRTRGCLAAAAEQDGVLLLVEDADPATLRTTISALIDSVAPGRWALGMSEPFLDLADARAALEQAHVALGSAEYQQIAFHDEMGPTVALLKHLPPGAAARFVEEILQPLADYDRERNGALIDTLAAYLRHRGSLRKAADELFVHSNTVQLRLARASQLTGIDLHDPRQLGILSLAFAWRGEPQA